MAICGSARGKGTVVIRGCEGAVTFRHRFGPQLSGRCRDADGAQRSRTATPQTVRTVGIAAPARQLRPESMPECHSTFASSDSHGSIPPCASADGDHPESPAQTACVMVRPVRMRGTVLYPREDLTRLLKPLRLSLVSTFLVRAGPFSFTIPLGDCRTSLRAGACFRFSRC